MFSLSTKLTESSSVTKLFLYQPLLPMTPYALNLITGDTKGINPYPTKTG